MGVRRFSNYLAGLPDDSAFIRKMREPHERNHEVRSDLSKQVAAAVGDTF